MTLLGTADSVETETILQNPHPQRLRDPATRTDEAGLAIAGSRSAGLSTNPALYQCCDRRS
jgi:hypothetical protein